MKINNVEQFRDGLYTIAEGFKILADTLVDEGSEKIEPVTEGLPEEEVIEEPVVEKEEVTEEPEQFERESLDKMSYRDLQKVAKDLDLVANGKKEELITRILGEELEEVAESIVDVVEDIPEEVEEIVEEVVEDEEIEEEEYEVTRADHIANALEDYSEEDLADVLDSIGESPKGKRQALLAKIVKAVDDGKLEIDLVNEEGEEVEDKPEPIEEVEEYITEARRQGIANVRKAVRENIEKEEISEDMIDETLVYVYKDIDTKLPLVEKKDLFEEIHSNLIDDEGTSHEFAEPYELNGEYACCSKHLNTLESGNLYCPICEQEYEVG